MKRQVRKTRSKKPAAAGRKQKDDKSSKSNDKSSKSDDPNLQPPTPGTTSSAGGKSQTNPGSQKDDVSIAESIKQQVATMEEELEKASLMDEDKTTRLEQLWVALSIGDDHQALFDSMGFNTVQNFVNLDHMSMEDLLNAFPRRDLRKESFQDTILYALCLGSCFTTTIREMFHVPPDARIPQRDIPATEEDTDHFIFVMDGEQFIKLYKLRYWRLRTEWFNFLEDNLPPQGGSSLIGSYVSVGHGGSAPAMRSHQSRGGSRSRSRYSKTSKQSKTSKHSRAHSKQEKKKR